MVIDVGGYLRSCYYRSIFDICMVQFVIFMVCGDGSSWYVEMVFFMVCGDGCILRSNGVLGKGVVYALIRKIILGVRMISSLCHGILLIRI